MGKDDKLNYKVHLILSVYVIEANDNISII